VFLVLGVLLAPLAAFLALRGHREKEAAPAGAVAFAAPETCFECHEQARDAWRGSHHDLAMQPATPETVLADFNDTTFRDARFTERDGRYYATLPEGEFEVLYTFGYTPLQQYLVATERGRLQALDLAWDTLKGEWFALQDPQPPPGDPLHWTGVAYNWNFMCAECHSTDLKKNYDAKTDTYHTSWFEVDVGCQGCHGPGADHVAWARAVGNGPYAVDDPKGLVVRLADKDPRVEVEACARCHARRSVVSEDYDYAGRFLDFYDLALLTEDLYEADGQIREEDYVYGSFLQSRMARAGVRCTHCHDPHTARLRLEGNLMCARCHKEDPPKEYEALKSKDYDRPEHHFHEQGKPGSFCKDCHMASRTYMVVDPRWDHSFRIPRPDLTISTGAPNACNDCHADKSAAWAEAEIRKRYPEPPPPHYGEVFAAARAGDRASLPGLRALAADAEQAGIVRATALHYLHGAGVAEDGPLEDPDPLVRLAAVQGHSRVPLAPQAVVARIAPRLRDPVRAVRVAAAQVLSEVPQVLLAPEQRADFEAALREYRARQAAYADRPDGAFNLAILEANLGNPQAAAKLYLQAIAREPRFAPARFNLANLYNSLGRNAQAEEQFRAVLERDPRNGEAHYSLGLLLVEMGRIEEACRELQRAAELLDRARVHHNLGLAWQKLGQPEQAERALLRAAELDPRAADTIQALVLLYGDQERWKEALPWTERLAELLPHEAWVKRLLEMARARAR